MRAGDAGYGGYAPWHDLGHLVVFLYAHDGDQVVLAGNRVDLGHVRDPGQRLARGGSLTGVRLNQDDGCDHARSGLRLSDTLWHRTVSRAHPVGWTSRCRGHRLNGNMTTVTDSLHRAVGGCMSELTGARLANPTGPSAHVDTYVRNNLPAAADWPR